MLGLGLVVTLAVATLQVWQPTLLSFFNHKTYDSLLHVVGQRPPTDQVTMVNVDEESLAHYGQWPWPHYRLARLIKSIHELGAAVIAVDFILSEPDRTSLSIIQRDMARELGVRWEARGLSAEFYNNERALASVLTQSKVVLGFKFVFDRLPTWSQEGCNLHPLQVVRRDKVGNHPVAPPWFQAQGVVCNIPQLAEASGSQGFLDVGLDKDGVLRRAPLLIEYQGHLYPSLALATYLRLRGGNQVVVQMSDLGPEMVQIRENRIPVDASARLLINYRSPAKAFQPLSAKSLLVGQAPREAIAGKVVLVGLSAAGLKDLLATPLDARTSGVEIQATMLDNLLRGDYLSSPAYSPGLELGLVLLCGSVSTWFFSRMRAPFNLALASGGALMVAGCSALFLRFQGVYWSPFWPLFTLLANFSLLSLARFWREEQRVKSRTQTLAATVEALQGEIAERRRTEEALQRSEQRFRALSEESPLGISVVDGQGVYEYINPAFNKMFGYTLQDFATGREWFRLVFPDPHQRREVVAAWFDYLSQGHQGEPRQHAFEVTCREGDRKTILFRAVPLPLGKQFILYEDLTERVMAEHEMRRLEEELFQSQKLEALGVLAGGIAHDFNNVLQAIMGYTQLMLDQKDVGEPTRSRLEHIDQSIQRAAMMIRRLMTMARKDTTRREKVDLNWEIKQAVRLLEHTLPKMVMITTSLAPDLASICGDPGQMEQVLLNLATNAAHAMPHGGELAISTRNCLLGPEEVKTMPGLAPGPHVQLSVRDTGSGMDEETRSHIFEPFFTTKPLDMGTGLGLSTAFAIISNHGGHIQCQSRLNHGTVFTIHLPAGGRQDEAKAAEASEPALFPTGQETILVVDDEKVILGACREALEGMGYVVLTAESGEQALELYRQSWESVSLILLDLNMPGMGGQECLREIMAFDPRAKVLVATGYADETVTAQALDLGAMDLITKPFRFRELILKMRVILDSAAVMG